METKNKAKAIILELKKILINPISIEESLSTIDDIKSMSGII